MYLHIYLDTEEMRYSFNNTELLSLKIIVCRSAIKMSTLSEHVCDSDSFTIILINMSVIIA